MQPALILSREVSLTTDREAALAEPVENLVIAWLTCAKIAVRSSRSWSASVFGVSSMTMEEIADAARGLLSCASVSSVVLLQRDLTPQMWANAFARFCLLWRIAAQIGEEACHPLQRWAAVELEKAPAMLCA